MALVPSKTHQQKMQGKYSLAINARQALWQHSYYHLTMKIVQSCLKFPRDLSTSGTRENDVVLPPHPTVLTPSPLTSNGLKYPSSVLHKQRISHIYIIFCYQNIEEQMDPHTFMYQRDKVMRPCDPQFQGCHR